MFRRTTRLAVPPLVLLAAAPLGGCVQPSCANYSVLDYLNSTDRTDDLAHLGLQRSTVVTRLGPGGTQAQCSVVEELRPPGATVTTLRRQSYSVRLVNNGWVMEK